MVVVMKGMHRANKNPLLGDPKASKENHNKSCAEHKLNNQTQLKPLMGSNISAQNYCSNINKTTKNKIHNWIFVSGQKYQHDSLSKNIYKSQMTPTNNPLPLPHPLLTLPKVDRQV